MSETTWLKYGVRNVEILEGYFSLVGLTSDFFDVNDNQDIIWTLVKAKPGCTELEVAVFVIGSVFGFICGVPEFVKGIKVLKEGGEILKKKLSGISSAVGNENELTKIEVSTAVDEALENLNNRKN